jgi:hypothetical protein
MDVHQETQRLIVGGASSLIHVIEWGDDLSLTCPHSMALFSLAEGVADIKWIRQGRACLVAQWNGSVAVYHVKRKCLLFTLPIPLRRVCSSLTLLSDQMHRPLEFLCAHRDTTFSLWSLFD